MGSLPRSPCLNDCSVPPKMSSPQSRQQSLSFVLHKIEEILLAPQSGALSILAFRDFHPIHPIQSTYRFECSKPLYGDLKQTKADQDVPKKDPKKRVPKRSQKISQKSSQKQCPKTVSQKSVNKKCKRMSQKSVKRCKKCLNKRKQMSPKNKCHKKVSKKCPKKFQAYDYQKAILSPDEVLMGFVSKISVFNTACLVWALIHRDPTSVK